MFSFQVHIFPVNDPPSIQGPIDKTFAGKEDTRLVLNAGRGIELADPDESGKIDAMWEVKVIAGMGNLQLPLAFAGGLYLLSGDQPDGSGEFWARGGLRELNRSLQRLEYHPPADWSGTDQLHVWVGDLGEGREDVMLEATTQLAVIIDSVNDKPKLSYPSPAQYLDEDTSLAIDFVSVSDADPGAIVTLKLQPDYGEVDISTANMEQGEAENIEISHVLSGGEQQALALRGLVEDVDMAAQILTYWPPTNFAGQVAVSIQATDEGGLVDEGIVYLYVRPINDPPVISSLGLDGHLPRLEITAGGDGDKISSIILEDVDVDDSSDLCTNIPGIEGRKALSLEFTPSAGVVDIHEEKAVGVRVVGATSAGPGEDLFLQGSLKLLQRALDGGHIKYSAPADFSGTDTVRVTVADGGNCGAGGVGTMTGILEVDVLPYDPPLAVEFDSSMFEGSVLLTQEDEPLVLPEVTVSGGSVGERAAVDLVLLAVSGNLTLAESDLENIALVHGTETSAQRLHMAGSPADLTHALSGLTFEPRMNFFGYWNRNGSRFDDTPVRSPYERGPLALARIDIVATPGGMGGQVVYGDGSRVRSNATWSKASVKISVGWVNDPPAVDAPRLIVVRGLEESPVPGVRVADADVLSAPGGRGRLEITISTSAGGSLAVDATVALQNGLRDDDDDEEVVRLRGQPEYVNNALATLVFTRANATEGGTIAIGDTIDEILVHVTDLGFSGAGGEQRVNSTILVKAGATAPATVGDQFASEKILPLVNATEGVAVALPGLEDIFPVTNDTDRVTVTLSAREGYLSLGPAGGKVAVAAASEEWGPAVTVIETTGGAETTLPEVQVN